MIGEPLLMCASAVRSGNVIFVLNNLLTNLCLAPMSDNAHSLSVADVACQSGNSSRVELCPLKRDQKVADICQNRPFSLLVERYPSVATSFYRTINLYKEFRSFIAAVATTAA